MSRWLSNRSQAHPLTGYKAIDTPKRRDDENNRDRFKLASLPKVEDLLNQRRSGARLPRKRDAAAVADTRDKLLLEITA
jgi:hypothetical protein